MENAVFALWHDPSCWLIYAEADWGIIMVLLGQIDVGGVVWGWMLRSICYSQQTLGLCCLWSPVLVISLAPVPNEDAECLIVSVHGVVGHLCDADWWLVVVDHLCCMLWWFLLTIDAFAEDSCMRADAAFGYCIVAGEDEILEGEDELAAAAAFADDGVLISNGMSKSGLFDLYLGLMNYLIRYAFDGLALCFVLEPLWLKPTDVYAFSMPSWSNSAGVSCDRISAFVLPYLCARVAILGC
ncbi:hypothetical protein Nepgr_025368 [Nepenthes gracilis]|uniref:Uncharacterized protein n=1 Tax=Nepenthes gracilis TaxID=150966 RepID=A0AAD3T4Z8_NEPGR|nr:hypothetical protein Nepgr_025368 [Nepenthes gracilis]